MVLALVRKELREVWPFAVLAMGFYIIYVSKLTGKGSALTSALFGYLPGMNAQRPEIPFVDDNFLSMYFLIGAVLAIALGFRQSAWEPSQGTALCLLHLPLTRKTIYVTKLLTGIGLLLACTLLPIVIYATWAAMPGTHPGPFAWSMAGHAFRVWLIMPLVYLGAFASGIRPARWLGSRLLPLVAVSIPTLFASVIPHWWLMGFPVLVLLTAILLCDILREIETRDF